MSQQPPTTGGPQPPNRSDMPEWNRKLLHSIERFIHWLAVYWLVIFNVGVGLYVGLPHLAPVLMAAGAEAPARVIYSVYAPLCHQFGYRSMFLFGEKLFYLAPEFEARTGIQPYTNAGRFQAKAFLGNEEMGYKVAYCERDVGIYGAIFVAGLVFAVIRKRRNVKPLNLILYALFGVGPIAFDGFSQLLSQPPFGFMPYFRESTPFFRYLTGSLFGLANVWLAYPYIEESMDEIRVDMARRLGLDEHDDTEAE